MKKIALITGISGQDGIYLSELLLSKKYIVHGIINKTSSYNISNKVILHKINLYSKKDIKKIISKIKPAEIYHLASKHFDKNRFNILKINILTTYYMLIFIKKINRNCKFFYASSSEIFGNTKTKIQSEKTKYSPRGVYGYSKLCGLLLTKLYRKKYNIHASSGILYNHESPIRRSNSVIKKIINDVIKIKNKKKKYIHIGNINIKRNYGHAEDYSKAMYLIIKQQISSDYIVCSDESKSIKKIIKTIFSLFGLDYKKYLKTDKKQFRKNDNNNLNGNNIKLKKIKWTPKKNINDAIFEIINKNIAS